LQAVGRHDFVNPLREPGNVDLTAHVDFQAVGQAAESLGARVFGPIKQSELLHRLGIETRAEALKKGSPLGKNAEINSALARLTTEEGTGMGGLFKAMAVVAPEIGEPPAFESTAIEADAQGAGHFARLRRSK
jgi:SAM-dependent MidA family methyltransferase